MFPEYMEIDGKQYKINTDYRYALACFKAIEDSSINDIERAYALVEILLGQPVSNMQEALEKIKIYLMCGEDKKKQGKQKRDMDFEYDEKLIYASFMSDYNIDLNVENLHWWKYCALISGLTESSVLNRVRDLRNTDLTEYKDPKTKQKIIKAMKNVELPQKEQQVSEETLDLLKELGVHLKGSE